MIRFLFATLCHNGRSHDKKIFFHRSLEGDHRIRRLERTATITHDGKARVNVTIQERRFSFNSEYNISAGGSHYYARTPFFSFANKLQLQGEDDRILAKIRSRFSWFRSKYDFELFDGRLYRFQCEKIWKGVFVCEGNEGYFRLYTHKGLNYSIFLNERQIAAFTRNSIVIGKGNRYDIRMNAGADVVIVLCMVLAVNTSKEGGDKATITFDFGNIGPEDRPFDKSWEPS